MNFKCLFSHDLKFYQVSNYIDISYGSEANSHAICYICKKCKKNVVYRVYGGGFLDEKHLKILSEDMTRKIYE